jgi:hypothetical protein
VLDQMSSLIGVTDFSRWQHRHFSSIRKVLLESPFGA